MAGRPRHKPTPENRGEVRSLISFGIRQDEICNYLGITDKTLNKHYKFEITTSQLRANAEVARVLYNKATKDKDLTAVIFWLKTRARWRTEDVASLQGENSDLKEQMRELRDELDAKHKKDY